MALSKEEHDQIQELFFQVGVYVDRYSGCNGVGCADDCKTPDLCGVIKDLHSHLREESGIWEETAEEPGLKHGQYTVVYDPELDTDKNQPLLAHCDYVCKKCVVKSLCPQAFVTEEEQAHLPVLQMRSDGTLTWCNEAYANLHYHHVRGEPKSLVGKKTWDVTAGGDRRKDMAAIKSAHLRAFMVAKRRGYIEWVWERAGPKPRTFNAAVYVPESDSMLITVMVPRGAREIVSLSHPGSDPKNLKRRSTDV